MEQEDEPEAEIALRQPVQGPTPGRPSVANRFAHLHEWEASLPHHWTFHDGATPSTFQPPIRLIVHLYSGHRRSGDLQWWVEGLLGNRYPDVLCLSIDTAIHQDFNVLDGPLWKFLLQAAREGMLIALVCGPPCESWSAAHALQLLNEQGQPIRGPRPLRDRVHLWGLAHRSLRELHQIHIGTVLLLRALHLAVTAANAGSKVIVEHPGLPWDATLASIWWTFIIQCLTHDCGLFEQVDLCQCHFGSPAIKPTRLLYANVPLARLLHTYERRDLVRPLRVLAGKNSDGSFATSVAKQYPRLFNMALAMASIHGLSPSNQEVDSTNGLVKIARDYHHFCQGFQGVQMPDYQPQTVELHV
eukprot:Skav236707  [mRNA]  locus=scaffold738:268514:269587:+ [translate_table: standard]